MSGRNYQIVLLLFIILAVVFVSGNKIHEGYDRVFNYADQNTKMTAYNNVLFDKIASDGTKTKSKYSEIIDLVSDLQRDILDYNVCNANNGNANFQGAEGTTGPTYQLDQYITSSGDTCREQRNNGIDQATRKGQLDTRIVALTNKITEFQTYMTANYYKMTDADVKGILGLDAIPTSYTNWRTVPTEGRLLRTAIITKLTDKSNAIKDLRSELDVKLAELNQVPNSNVMINKITMDSTIYASLLWTVLATTLIGYVVSTA